MEASLLNPTQRYATAALFAIALHHSQLDQIQASVPVARLHEEIISDGMSVGKSASVSEAPHLWVHEKSGLLWPVLGLLGVDKQSWEGLKETAGSSSQVRHHLGSFLTLLSEKNDGCSLERTDKELALTKAVEAMVLSMEGSPVSREEAKECHDYENKCHVKYSSAEASSESFETPKGTRPDTPNYEKVSRAAEGQTWDKPVKEATQVSCETKMTLLYSLLSACVADDAEGSKKGYDARHRVALRLLATWLGVDWLKVEAMEIIVASSFMESVKGVSDGKTKTSEVIWDKMKHGSVIGAAALAGGTVMAVTGGLAAPAIAEGLGALGFAAAASATGSVAGSAAVAASFGVAGAGLTGSKMSKRIGSLEEFEFKAVGENQNQGRLAVGIFVSGFVSEVDDLIGPWEGHTNNLERYALLWESKNLIALTTAIQDWLTSKIAIQLMSEGAMLTVLSTLVSAFALPAALVTASDLIDSQWAVALDRSDKAGRLLAEVLLQGQHGNRPVTLIGFSLGARVIFKCLRHLAETKGDNAGLVERVVLLGAPVPIKDENWEDARKMVAGRFVNAYSTNDWILGVTYRASLLSQGLAGIQPVDVSGIENIDVSHQIEGHSSYLWKTKEILEQLELDSYYPVIKTTQAKPHED
ncbi:hypothetical protein UlMin_034147 [Ulmus minor]